jgi:hypothetical protein
MTGLSTVSTGLSTGISTGEWALSARSRHEDTQYLWITRRLASALINNLVTGERNRLRR